MTSKEVFEKFIPATAVSYCNKLYEKLGFEFKVKKARQTKLGDYRYDPHSDRHTITINNDLNSFSFLVTYLHEVAHLIAFKQYGNRVAPHGKEWKHCFVEVAKPMLTEEVFDGRVLTALNRYFNNPKASSCSDPVLYNILKQFDGKETMQLKDIPIGEVFSFNKRAFKKLEKKRTRSICLELESNRKYAIAEIAEVDIPSE